MANHFRKITENSLYTKHSEKIKFLIVGGLNTVLDFLIFSLLANILTVPIIIANMASTLICMIVSFFLNYNFVWKSKKSKRQTAPRFLAVSLFSAWVIQSGVIWLITSITGASDITNLIAKVIGIICGMIFNYLGYKFIFK
ncbi:MAG: GtrA family protein [Candidatus Nomurabacteria bacterium]|nr:GtrA family protein [Candidatus Nomurabacteria bacterium]